MFDWLRRRPRSTNQPLRLPVDVVVSQDDRGVPDLASLTGTVDEYVKMRAEALEGGGFARRAEACWGLVARGRESLAWCRAALESDAEEDVEDAVGVLAYVGVPPEWLPWIEDLAQRVDEESADAVMLLLPPESQARVAGDDEQEGDFSRLEGVPFEGRYEPFTETIYFVDAPYESVLDYNSRSRLRLHGEHPPRWSETSGGLDEMLGLLEPVATPNWKSLIVETSGDWTAFFSQSGSGLDYLARFARTLSARVLYTSWSPHVVRNGEVLRHGNSAMWMWEPVAGGNYRQTRRVIQASRQPSRWEWSLSGDPLPFEDTSRYEARVIRERFDIHALNEFCRHLGIHRDDPAFYGPRATLEELDTTSWPNKPRAMPSAQWRAEHS